MRCSIFIDGNNFYHGLRAMYGKEKKLKNFNFKEFCDYLVRNNFLINIYYYNAKLDKQKDIKKYYSQKEFFEKLLSIRKLKLVLCTLLKRKVNNTNYYILKEDDIHMAVDIVEGSCDNKFDLAFVVSGDGDFVPAVDSAKKRGKKVINVYFKKSSSRLLKNHCDSSLELNKSILDRFFHGI